MSRRKQTRKGKDRTAAIKRAHRKAFPSGTPAVEQPAPLWPANIAGLADEMDGVYATLTKASDLFLESMIKGAPQKELMLDGLANLRSARICLEDYIIIARRLAEGGAS